MKRLLMGMGTIALMAGLVGSWTGEASAADPRLLLAHRKLLRLDVEPALKLLSGMNGEDDDVKKELALAHIYKGDCKRAVSLLESMGSGSPAGLSQLAHDCAEVTAGAMVVEDKERGIIIRFKNSADKAMAPMLFDVAAAGRELLKRDLQVSLPKPLRIDLISDQYSLSKMTGLPLKAAQTTGTVAIAKWGRVTMLSPRANPGGLRWADTLVHEMTHLAITRASADRAPLWLQEGVAKHEEIRWRQPSPWDEMPSPSAVANWGFRKQLGLDLDNLGPSIALLPSAEQAMVAYAEVASFINYWTETNGPEALPKLLSGLAVELSAKPVDGVLKRVSKYGLSEWNRRWRAHLKTKPQDLPPDLKPGYRPKNHRQIQRASEVGALLSQFGHHKAALAKVVKPLGKNPKAMSLVSIAGVGYGKTGQWKELEPLVKDGSQFSRVSAEWHSLRGAWARRQKLEAEANLGFLRGFWARPLHPDSACQWKTQPDLPADAAMKTLCAALRKDRWLLE